MPVGIVSPPDPTQAGKNPSLLGAIGNFMNSPGGAAVVQGVGGLLDDRQQKAMHDEDLAQRQAESGANVIQRQLESNQADDRARAQGALEANKLGDYSNFAARNAMLSAVLPQLQNFSVTPGDPAVAAAMPTLSGGFTIPHFTPEMLAGFSADATAREIANRENAISRLDPTRAGNPGIFSSLNLGAGSGANPEYGNEVNSFRLGQAQTYNDARAQAAEALKRAIDNDPTASRQAPPEGYEYDSRTGQLKKKGGGVGGFFKKIGKAALGVGVGALTGGIGNVASNAVSGALSNAILRKK
jgi:hypothetical protein